MADLTVVQNFVPVFPTEPLVYHGSGVVCRNGQVLYVYVPRGNSARPQDGGEIRGVYFASIADYAFAAVGAETFPVEKWYRSGKPIEGSDHAIIERAVNSACTVWWGGGTLWLTALYAEPSEETGWTSGPGKMKAKLKAEMWMSPSGNGGDWVKAADLSPPGDWEGDAVSLRGSNAHSAGMGTETPAGLAVPITLWIEGHALGWTRPSIVLGPGSWNTVHEHEYYGGQYGYQTGRRIVPHNGEFFFNSTGNVQSSKTSVSSDGSNWFEYYEPPLAHALRAHLISQNGLMHRMGNLAGTVAARPVIQTSPTPQTGPWVEATKALNMGDIRDGSGIGHTSHQTGWLWIEMSPGIWALYNHDKVWFVFGGWVLGAIGRS